MSGGAESRDPAPFFYKYVRYIKYYLYLLVLAIAA